MNKKLTSWIIGAPASKNLIISILMISSLMACSQNETASMSPIKISEPQTLNAKVEQLTNITPPPQQQVMTDDDGNLRTVEYYKTHPDELIKKIWECSTFSQSREGYENCLNAKKSESEILTK